MKRLHPAERYANDVITGKKPACKWERLACERYFRDKENQKQFVFDEEQAQIRIDFIQELSFSSKEWAGTPFTLQPWQQFIIWNLFGWYDKDGLRRYTDATINIPKKNGKTELAAAIANCVAILDKVINGQVVMAATSREQASICLKAAKDMILLTPGMLDHFEIFSYHIVARQSGSLVKAVSAEGKTAEGKGAACVIMDEEHEQEKNTLRDNLKSGMASTGNPLFISISTAGTNRFRPYYKHLETCKAILDGRLTNETHFIIIFGADVDDPDPKKHDDWRKESTWIKANPNYGISVKAKFIQSQFVNTQNEPSTQPNFKTKHINIWTDAATTWIDHAVWMKGKRDIKIEDYASMKAFGGMDLASSMDFTAVPFMIPQVDGTFAWIFKFYIPEDMAKKRTERDKIMFEDWGRAGWITLTPGNVTDYDYIERDVKQYAAILDIQKIGFDAKYSYQLVNNLTDYGVPMEPFSQGIMSVSFPTKEFERLCISDRFIHDGNPVMAWMMGNVFIHTDANENKRIHRGKSTDKVDGPVACINALGVYLTELSNPTEQAWAV